MNCPKCTAQMTDPYRDEDVSPWYRCPACGCMRHRLWMAGWKARGKALTTSPPKIAQVKR